MADLSEASPLPHMTCADGEDMMEEPTPVPGEYIQRGSLARNPMAMETRPGLFRGFLMGLGVGLWVGLLIAFFAVARWCGWK